MIAARLVAVAMLVFPVVADWPAFLEFAHIGDSGRVEPVARD